MEKVFWFDCETTGLDPDKCAIIQLAGLVEIDNEIVETVDLYMRPLYAHEKKTECNIAVKNDIIYESALAVNEWTLDEVFEGDHPKVAIDSLTRILDKYVDKYKQDDKFVCAGKNVKFDAHEAMSDIVATRELYQLLLKNLKFHH